MIAVVGGGIAGLAAAYELHRRGLPFRLLERARRPGGLILTEQTGGFLLEAGPDSVLVQKPAAADLCRELGIHDRLIPTERPRTAFIARRGRLHALPDEAYLGIPIGARAVARAGFLSPAARLRVLIERLIPPRVGEDDESIAQFMGRRFGREAVDYVADPLLAGIYAGDVERLSMRALFPRLVDLERSHGSVLRGLARLRPQRPPDGAFLGLRGGMGELVDALVRALPASALELGNGATRVRAATGQEGYWLYSERAEPRLVSGVIVATPAYAAADLVAELDPELSAECRAISYVSTATISLGYRRDAVANPLAGMGFLVPRCERRHILAVSWASSKWPGRAPPGYCLLRVFAGSATDAGVLERTDEDLVRVVEEEVRRFIQIREGPVLARVCRWERAGAQHEVGHLARLARIERKLNRWRGLQVTGSAFRAIGIPDCIADARAAAAAARNCTSR